MKKIYLILILFFVSTIAFSQTQFYLPGLWKATVKAKNTTTLSTYILLDTDGTYIWGVDSSSRQPNNIDKSVRGTWGLTGENEIKLIPADETGNVSYYVKINEVKFKYMYYDKNGVKTKDNIPEMSYYLEKIIN